MVCWLRSWGRALARRSGRLFSAGTYRSPAAPLTTPSPHATGEQSPSHRDVSRPSSQLSPASTIPLPQSGAALVSSISVSASVPALPLTSAVPPLASPEPPLDPDPSSSSGSGLAHPRRAHRGAVGRARRRGARGPRGRGDAGGEEPGPRRARPGVRRRGDARVGGAPHGRADRARRARAALAAAAGADRGGGMACARALRRLTTVCVTCERGWRRPHRVCMGCEGVRPCERRARTGCDREGMPWPRRSSSSTATANEVLAANVV